MKSVEGRRLAGWRLLAVFVPLFLVAPIMVASLMLRLWGKVLEPGYNRWYSPVALEDASGFIAFFPGPSLLVGVVASVLWYRLTGRLRFWHPMLFVLLAVGIFCLEFIILMALGGD